MIVALLRTICFISAQRPSSVHRDHQVHEFVWRCVISAAFSSSGGFSRSGGSDTPRGVFLAPFSVLQISWGTSACKADLCVASNSADWIIR